MVKARLETDAMKVCMLVTNPVSNDPRVRREAATLVKAGYQVVVIGVQGKESSPEEWLDGYRVVRVPLPGSLRRHVIPHFLVWLKSAAPRLYTVLRDRYRSVNPRKLAETSKASSPLPERSTLRSDLLNLIHVLRINLKMAKEAIKQHADVYHAHDLDTLLAGYIAKLRTRKKLVYDFHELYTEQFMDGVKTGAWRFYYSSPERALGQTTHPPPTRGESFGGWGTQRYRTAGGITVRHAPGYQPLPPGSADRGREPVILYHGGDFLERGLEQLIESGP